MKIIKTYELDSEIHNYANDQMNLDIIYFDSKIVPRNINKAIHLY